MMKSIAIAAGIALTGGGVAMAQSLTGAALVDSDFSEIEQQFGLSPASGQIGRLAADGAMTGTFNVAPNASYIVHAGCDEYCQDIGLVVRDASGNEVGSDRLLSNIATVGFRAGSGGRYTFEVQMQECRSASCNYGVRVYEQTTP